MRKADVALPTRSPDILPHPRASSSLLLHSPVTAALLCSDRWQSRVPYPHPEPHPPGSGPASGSGGWVPMGRPGRLAEGSPGQVCGSHLCWGWAGAWRHPAAGRAGRESPGLTCRTLVGLFQVLSLHGGAQASPGSYFPEHGGVAPSLIKAAAQPASPEEELSPQSGRSGSCENHLHLQTIVVPAAPTSVTSELPRGCAGWDLKLANSWIAE